MSDPNFAANQIAHRTRNMPSQVMHVAAALRTVTPDGYPNGGDRTGSSGPSDPTAGAALARTTGTGPGYRTADDWAELLHAIATMQAALDTIAALHQRYARAHSTPADRCSGLIDPTCTRIRDGHPDHHGLCAPCALLACRTCWKRPADQRRSPVTHDKSCEACYRRESRAA